MSNANPYAPPRATVADVEDDGHEVQPVHVWTSQGRIGRLRYLAYHTGGYLLFMFGGLLLGGFLMALGAGIFGGLVMAGGVIAYFAYIIFKAIQRAHDMGWSGWTVLTLVIPFVVFIWLFNPGTPGPNRFGAPPPPNTAGVKILAWMFPLVMVIGIVAAIALPAYQNYAKRTHTVLVR